MHRWIPFALFSFFTASLPGATTVAWKIPVKSLIYDYQTNPDVLKLDKAPASSPFFQSGDSLWDISKVLSEKWRDPEQLHAPPFVSTPASSLENSDPFAPGNEPPPQPLPPAPKLPPIKGSWTGEFVVWDERSGLIVARGEDNEIAALEAVLGFRKLPVAFSTKVELVDSKAAAKNSRSLTLLAKSEEEASARTGDFEATLKITDVYIPLREVELTASWQAEDQLPCEVDASATVRDGVPFRFAKRGSEEIIATVTRVLPEGTPYLAAARLYEVAGEIKPWPEEREEPILPSQPLGGDLFICWFPMETPDSWGIASSDLKQITSPKEWQDRIHGALLDIKQGLMDKGLSGTRFGGYDPFARMGVIVGSATDVDVAGVIGASNKCFLGRQTIWSETTAQQGDAPALGISCAVGYQASISGKNTAGQDCFEFTAETPDDDEHYSRNLLELHYTDRHDPAHPADISLSTALTLWEENPVIIGSLEDEDEPTRSRNFTTTMFSY